jgi:hypothetical protein
MPEASRLQMPLSDVFAFFSCQMEFWRRELQRVEEEGDEEGFEEL